jgi:hypothetical protein
MLKIIKMAANFGKYLPDDIRHWDEMEADVDKIGIGWRSSPFRYIGIDIDVDKNCYYTYSCGIGIHERGLFRIKGGKVPDEIVEKIRSVL